MSEQALEQHGQMVWTGCFDEEGYAILRCTVQGCGREIGLRPGDDPIKFIEQGDFFASHTGFTTLPMIKAAYEQEIWSQPPGSGEILEMLEQLGGKSPITFRNLSIAPST